MTGSKSLEEAAVLVPLFRGEDDELRLVLVRRSNWGIHGGEIAFPGGKRIPTDNTLLDTALREAREEIAVCTKTTEILEHLPVVDTHASGFRVSPFLARIVPPSKWHRNEREIAEILEVRINDFTRPEARGQEMKQLPAWPEPQKIPFYRIGEYKLWGATYRILHPLVPRIINNEWLV